MREVHYPLQFQSWVKDEADQAQGYEGGVIWLDTLDAPDKILAGSWVNSEYGRMETYHRRGEVRILPAVQAKPGRGRPKAGGKTSAERQAKFRAERVQVKVGERMGDTIRSLAADFDLTESEVCEKLMRFALMNRNWRQTGF